jgi:hypothetical protein
MASASMPIQHLVAQSPSKLGCHFDPDPIQKRRSTSPQTTTFTIGIFIPIQKQSSLQTAPNLI